MTVAHRQNNSTRLEGNLALSTGFISGDFRQQNRSSKRPGSPISIHRATSPGFSSKPQRKSYSERLEVKKNTKAKLVGLLAKVGESDLSERVKLCGSKFEVLRDKKAVISRKPFHKCNHKLCPFCAARRSKKIVGKYLKRAQDFVRFGKIRVEPVHLVLTEKHRKGEMLADSRKRLMVSFRKLTGRNFWKRYFAGGLYSIEMTLGKDGLWHCHLHVLAFRRRFFDISILRSEWQKITGDSHVLRLDKVTGLETGLREICKYLSKPADISKFGVKQISEILKLKGARMFGTFGEFGKFCREYEESATDNENEFEGLSEGDICPCGCGEKLIREVMTVDELIAFARKGEIVYRK